MSAQETQGFSIEHLCALGGVSRAGFYRYGELRAPERTEADLRDKIQKIALENRFYGYRRVCQDLWRIHGLKVNHKHVRRLMREDNLLCLRAKPFVPYTTNSRHEFPIVPNLVRGLVPTGIDQIWVADITYIRLATQFIYLAVILDAHSRKVIGWALADHLEASLAIEALDMALAARRPARAHSSLRPRRAIRLQRVRRTAGGARRQNQHEPRRQPLRQRQGRALHANPEGGGSECEDLGHDRRSQSRHRRLHRKRL
jgi:transposase InsO family protein